MNSSGTITALTLPTGVTLSSTKVGRFATIAGGTFLVNSPNVPLWIDLDDTVRTTGIAAPASPVTVAAGSGTGLTGAYRVKYSYVVKQNGKVIAESALSPRSGSVTLANQNLAVTNAGVSPDAQTTGRRFYRTTSGGNTYFQWIDLDDNTQTSITDGLSDAGLSLLPAPVERRGVPTGVTLITAWKDRLWAAGDPNEIDTLYFTEEPNHFSWTNSIIIPPKGADQFGVTGFAPLRDSLGVFKRDSIHRVRGNTFDTVERDTVAEGVGCVAPDSVVVIQDRAYFLGEGPGGFGVYRWDAGGVENLSLERAQGWFNTTTYFNQSRFNVAFAKYNPAFDAYELHLAATGTTAENRWVMYRLATQKWYGPHKTDAFTPSFAALLEDANDVAMPVIAGTDGFLYQMNQAAFTDGASTAIDYDAILGWLSGNTPDIEKVWLQPAVVSKVQAAGTLTITPRVGGLDASDGTALSHDLTLGRERLPRIGQGRLLRLQLRHNTNAQGCEVYGLELPFHELGRR